MSVQVESVGVPLVCSVGHQHGVKVPDPVPEVAIDGEEVTWEGRVPSGQENSQVEHVRPLAVARPLRTDHSQVT